MSLTDYARFKMGSLNITHPEIENVSLIATGDLCCALVLTNWIEVFLSADDDETACHVFQQGIMKVMHFNSICSTVSTTQFHIVM